MPEDYSIGLDIATVHCTDEIAYHVSILHDDIQALIHSDQSKYVKYLANAYSNNLTRINELAADLRAITEELRRLL